MADNSSYRSYRQNDPLARRKDDAESGGTARAQSDPLAELARLIGQNDPFADLGRGSAAPAPRRSADEAPATDWRRESAGQGAYTQPPHELPAATGTEYPASHSYYQDVPQAPAYAPVGSDPRIEAQHYDSQGYDEHRDEAAAAFQPAYDTAAYDTTADARGYVPDPYYQGGAYMRAPREDTFDDAPAEQGRSPLAMVLAVVGLIVVGSAGAYAYRTYFGAQQPVKPPPVIQADATPSKVVPPTKAATRQSSKLINDRLVTPAQGERVVSREEEPVEFKKVTPSSPRVVFPPLANGNASLGAGSAEASTMTPPSTVLGQPKRVQTVIIRADQPGGAPTSATAPMAAPAQPAARAPEPPPASAPARVASAPPVSVDLPPATPPKVTPKRTVTTRRVVPAPAARSSNAPLSLAPQTLQPARAPRALAPSQPRVAAAPSAPVTSGGYNVQVSSQRSQSSAQASFRSLQARYPNQLGGRTPIIRRVNLGARGVYYRAMVGPFPTIERASALCSQLKAAGGQCVVQRN